MPVWNEEECLPKSLESLKRQTVMPDKVVVVDDGSTDRTPDILSELGDPFQVVNKSRSYTTHYYTAVILEGSKHLDKNVDYVGILDADIILEPRYYEKVLQKLQENSKLGISGGRILGEKTGAIIYGLPPYPYGANRVYTGDCWKDVNDGNVVLPPHLLTDAVDTYHYLKAFMDGYEPKRFDSILSRGLRPVTPNPYRLFVRGYSCYELGYYPWYLFGRAIYRLKPHYLAGYLKAWAMGAKKIGPVEFTKAMELHRIKKILHIKTELDPTEVLKAVSKTILIYRKRSKASLHKDRYQL